jgi:hypothetical protein
MNPVFTNKLRPDQVEKDGRVYALSDVSGSSAAQSQAANYTPVPAAATGAMQVANVPLPEPSPLAKRAPQEKRSTFAGVLGNLFGGAAARTSTEDTKSTVAARSLRTENAVKPRAKPTGTASALSHTKPMRHATAKAVARVAPKHGASPEPAVRQVDPAQPPVRQAAAAPTPAPRTSVRTAFSGSGADARGLLAGAQPALPAGNFDARWSALH